MPLVEYYQNGDSLVGSFITLIEDETWTDAFWVLFRARDWNMRAFATVVQRSAERIARSIEDMLRRWSSRARARIAYRPGGAGYLEARRDFMVRSGQTRATRSYTPY